MNEGGRVFSPGPHFHPHGYLRVALLPPSHRLFLRYSPPVGPEGGGGHRKWPGDSGSGLAAEVPRENGRQGEREGTRSCVVPV